MPAITKKAYEAEARQLIDRRIVDVKYREILYSNEAGDPLAEPQWKDNPRFDSLDFGLDLHLDDDTFRQLTWGNEFYSYGVSVLRHSAMADGADRIWHVGNESRWRTLLNQRVADVEIDWGSVREARLFSKRIDYPQSIMLTFGNRAEVIVSAWEWRADGVQYNMADHITVFFDRETAIEYNAWARR